MHPPRILIVVNADWFFWSHRLKLAKVLKSAGCDVAVVAAVERGYDSAIRAEGLRFIPLPLRRNSYNAFREASLIYWLWKLYRNERPDIVHHVTIKPVLYGSLAARAARVPAVINAISGLGYMFGHSTFGGRIREHVTSIAYRIALRGHKTRVIFQNPEDRSLFIRRGIVSEEKAMMVRGSGVDMQRFAALPEPEGTPTIVLASRMIWDKGVGDLVEAARKLKARGRSFRLQLVGVPDPANPNSLREDDLRKWEKEGIAEWLGHRDDMPEVLQQAAIVALPSSYREGVPKVLIEAAAVGRPIVTSDMPGCREIVRHGENGFLVPPGDPARLAEALDLLLSNRELRREMGQRGHEIAAAEFTDELVIAQTLTAYRDLLGARWPGTD